jgi:hypothetical protein
MQKPDRSKISYSEKAVRKAAKRLELPHGTYRFVVVEAAPTIGESEKTAGNLQVTFKCAALKDPNDPTSFVRPFLRDSITVPVDNPDIDGHKAPTWAAGLARQTLEALYDEEEMKRAPHKVDGVWHFDGAEMDLSEDPIEAGAQREEAAVEAMTAVFDKALDLFYDPSDLKDRVFYGKVGFDKTGQFTNILSKWSELPEGEELTDLVAAMSDGDNDEDETETPAPKAKLAAKKGKAKK